MKKILMIAFHFPPLQGGSGILRTLKFSRYLPSYGWQPIILTAHPRAYPQRGDDQLSEIPPDVPVSRVFALDTARHLAVRGSYLSWMALPDRWVSWCLGAVPIGLSLIRKYRPQFIWSTYPIATAHLIGLLLHRLTGIPWIADFRDSMTEEDYPRAPTTKRVYQWIERRTIESCTRAVFTAPGTLRMYAKRYPETPRRCWTIIPNGYDEEDFMAVEDRLLDRPSPAKPLILLHSGVLYPVERDPQAFFTAVAELCRSGKIASSDLKIILRGSGSEDFYRLQLHDKGIANMVFLEPSIPYHEALGEILQADGLLLFQASNCNHQIPAKVYEYLRARRPIFAITDPKGDTAHFLHSMGIDTIVPLDSKEQITNGLLNFITCIRRGCAPIAMDKKIKYYSRKSLTHELVNVLRGLSSS